LYDLVLGEMNLGAAVKLIERFAKAFAPVHQVSQQVHQILGSSPSP